MFHTITIYLQSCNIIHIILCYNMEYILYIVRYLFFHRVNKYFFFEKDHP